MHLLDQMSQMGHEQVLFGSDPASGLRTIIAVHDTTLGPALGGCRMWRYRTEEEALTDVLRLSRGMTYKAALAGLDLGGGKSVILGDAATAKSERLFRRFGQMVESLGGRYITAEDVGTTVADMEIVARETRHVTGKDRERGGSGDPSPLTAWGVFCGIRACLTEVFGSDKVKGRRVAVQGVGKVGLPLARLLAEHGAELVVADSDSRRVQAAVAELKAKGADADGIFDADCDVLSPCALGGGLNDATIPRLRCRVVAGSANNQLLEPRHGQALADRGILYAPDYAINAGGLINVDMERTPPYDLERARRRVSGVFDTMLAVLEKARKEGMLPFEAADRLAEERIERARKGAARPEMKGAAVRTAT